MPVLDAELDAALKAMDLSFHVRLIGTFAPDLVYAPAEAHAASWLAQNYPIFDQFPVMEGDATIGVLDRSGDHSGKTVRQAMQPLSEGVIVAADMPIADLIPQFRESHYRLILRGGRMDGLVTQSDLLKLPVRMLLFGLISHLEMCFRALVRERSPWPTWTEHLKPERRKILRKDLRKLKGARFEPDPLELSKFSDVVFVLAQQQDFGDDFRAKANPIVLLRNDIAHARTYLRSIDDTREFVDRFTSLRDLLARVSRMTEGPK